MKTTDEDRHDPWHSGERQLHVLAGVADKMKQIGARVIRDYMPDQHREFFQQLPFMVLGSVDAQGDAWASILTGHPGFAVSPEPRRLRVNAMPPAEDPACDNIQQGMALGMLGIELETRRRNRVNGVVSQLDEEGFELEVEHSFGNCPQYIQKRDYSWVGDEHQSRPSRFVADELNEAARRMIRQADTLFVASYVDDPVSGKRSVDVSHRGGRAGFVQVEQNRLTIPDFSGNFHFNTLGNFMVNPRAGLLFIDFETGDLLQLTGQTELVLSGSIISTFKGAERLWHLDVKHMVYRPAALPLRWSFTEWSPKSLQTGVWQEGV